jgi:hypothetical protein
MGTVQPVPDIDLTLIAPRLTPQLIAQIDGAATTLSVNPAPMITAIGIDVGGARKGFHAVAITDGAYSNHLATGDVQELSHWCRETVRARVIAIDAPCRWSHDGHSRPAERELMKQGIRCFSTPTRENSATHERPAPIPTSSCGSPCRLPSARRFLHQESAVFCIRSSPFPALAFRHLLHRSHRHGLRLPPSHP